MSVAASVLTVDCHMSVAVSVLTVGCNMSVALSAFRVDCHMSVAHTHMQKALASKTPANRAQHCDHVM